MNEEPAGDIVYNHPALPDTRGELADFLADVIEFALGDYETERFSNGYVADVLFRLIDVMVTSEEQKAALLTYLNEELEKKDNG